MLDAFDEILRRKIAIPDREGPNKVADLSNAIQKLVRPGMTLQICTTHNRPGAIVYELVRQFEGKDPGFSLSTLGVVSTAVLLVHKGLVKKLITTFSGDSYPTPGPNPVIGKAYTEGRIKIENWSILTFPMRLLAGAMGIPYIPTHSLIGSSMAEENREWFEVTTDPGTGEEIGLLKAFQPDLAFVHAPYADAAGNALLTPPYGEEVYGAWAAKQGVILTVEKVVSTELIRRYSYLTKIPSCMVKAVCEVPFGAHPGGVSSEGLPEFDSYADDYEFIQDFRKACKSEADLNAWIKEWVYDCPTWEAYLEKLGQDRIWFLKGKADRDSWKSELLTLSSQIPEGPEYSPVEMMVVTAGRKLADRVKKCGYQTILAGVGASNLSAWLAYYQLREENIHCELMAEIGFFGYMPRPADPFIFNYRNLPTCKMLTGIPTIMGVLMAGSKSENIGSIGAAQVDKSGNVNSTKIPGKMYFVGSGGANDICSSACEVMVTALQDKYRFVDKVAYITSPGRRVRTVVSDIGVYEKPEGSAELILTGYFAGPGRSDRESAVRYIKDQCGFTLKVADTIEEIHAPTLEELNLLRLFDPRRQFLEKR